MKKKFNIPGLNSLAPMVSKDLVCFDFVGDAIKAATLKELPAKKALSGVYYKDVRGLSREDIVNALREFAQSSSKRAQRDVIATIPSNLVITKNIEIPSQDPKEIKEIINLQAGRLTPYAREEVIIDYVRIGTFRQSYTKLLLIIVNKDVVKKQLGILEEAGIRANKIVLSSEAMGMMVHQHLKFEVQDSPFCLIHTDFSSTDFGIYIKDRQIFLRSISMGAHQLTGEKEKYLPRFIDELKKSFDAYQAEDIEVNPSLVVFTGAIDDLKDLEVMMLDAFRMPVRVLSVVDLIGRSDSVSKDLINPRSISMLNVIAPLFKSETAVINLIPEEVKLRQALEERGKDIIRAGVLVMTIILFICGIFLVHIYLKSEYLHKFASKFKGLNEEASQIEKDFSKVRIIRNYLSVRGLSLNVLSELYDLTPLEVSLTSIRLKEKGAFSIRGEASSMSAVFSYVNDLEKSTSFKNVKTKYTSKKKVDNQELVDFEIAAVLEGAREEAA
ncbi:MAG: pilus assembly protein PilM [Candidatus Omnitrophota bacterium]